MTLCAVLARGVRPCAAAKPFTFVRSLNWPSFDPSGAYVERRGVYWSPVTNDNATNISNGVVDYQNETLPSPKFPAGWIGAAWWDVRTFWPPDIKDALSPYGVWPLPLFRYSVQVNDVAVPGYSRQLATMAPAATASTGGAKAREYYAESVCEAVDWLGRASPWHERYELTAPLCPVWLRSGDRMSILLHSPVDPATAQAGGLYLPTVTIVAGWMWPESEDGACSC